MSKQDNPANAREAELLSSLIGDIHDTTLDRSLWPATLKKIAAFVRGASAAVFWNDAASGGGDVYFEDGGIDPAYRNLYFEKYVKLNPITTPRFFALTEVPVRRRTPNKRSSPVRRVPHNALLSGVGKAARFS